MLRPNGGWARVPWLLLLALFGPAGAAYALLLRDTLGFRFAQPLVLLALPVLGVLFFRLVFLRNPLRVAAMRHARASELGRLPRGLVARTAALPNVLRLLALTLLVFALARPQTSRKKDEIELEGIDIVVVLDVSGSMEEQDLIPNRLEAAKGVIRSFVERRRSDRIAMVLFARDAYTYVPLTLDHGTYQRMLADLQIGIIDGGGTAIGNGIGVALARLRKSEAASKVVILLTDGDNNAGNISPLEAAKMAQTMKVKVYTILAGTAPAADQANQEVPQNPANPKLLEEIATMTGGSPYLATDTGALAQRFESILQDLEKSSIRDRAILYAELFSLFLWPALFLILLEALMRLTRWRSLP